MAATLGALGALLTLAVAGTAGAQPAGYASVVLDALPNAPVEAVELRARLFAEDTFRPAGWLTIHLAGYAEGLVADRQGRETDAIVRAQDAYVEMSGARADLRAGYSRLVWGRLDEVQPGDVVNPLDLARYFFEGRGEARLPVPLVRGRMFFGERATLEAVLVPGFRRGRFDQLDEESSPFLERGAVPPFRAEASEIRDRTPFSGGVRGSLTTGRVDWALSAYRGFRSFPEYEVLATAQPPAVREVFPRYTMVAGDFETASGAWAWRGEAAVFFEDDGVDGHPCGAPGCGATSADAGAGFDRRAGGYHISGTLLVRTDILPVIPAGQPPPDNGAPGPASGPAPFPLASRRDTSVSLVAAADRAFARERYRTRTFCVYNMNEGALFLRNITTMEVRENVAVEGSIGWFAGAGDDVFARFGDRDFLYIRLRYHF